MDTAKKPQSERAPGDRGTLATLPSDERAKLREMPVESGCGAIVHRFLDAIETAERDRDTAVNAERQTQRLFCKERLFSSDTFAELEATRRKLTRARKRLAKVTKERDEIKRYLESGS